MSKKIEKIKEYIKNNKLKSSITGAVILTGIIVVGLIIAVNINSEDSSNKIIVSKENVNEKESKEKEKKVEVVNVENKKEETKEEKEEKEEIQENKNIETTSEKLETTNTQPKPQQSVQSQRQEQPKPQQSVQSQRQEQLKPQQSVQSQRQEQLKPQPKPEVKPDPKPNTEDEPLMIYNRVWVPINKWQKVFYTEEELNAYVESLPDEAFWEGGVSGWTSVPSNKNGGVVYVIKINGKI